MSPSPNQNIAITQCGESALRNLRLGLWPEKTLPDPVFSSERAHFRFFSSDEIFAPEFVGKLKMLLQIEGAACACITNLDGNTGNGPSEAFFLNRLTTPEEYLEQLKGDGQRPGWLHRMDRFGVTSDMGGWLIYCEKANEIAAIGFEVQVGPGKIDHMSAQLGGLPVKAAVAKPVSIIFASKRLPTEWSDILIRNYPG